MTDPRTGTIGLVVVNFRSYHHIETNLGDVHDDRIRVIIVDNFADSDERAATERMCVAHEWDFVALSENDGFGVGVNAGARRAIDLGAEVILLLNPDARASAHVLCSLADHVIDDPMAIVSPRVVGPTGTVEFAGSKLYLRSGQIKGRNSAYAPRGNVESVEWLTGACMALHRTAWESLGGFDRAFFMYWEDVDLSVRAERLGIAPVVREDLEVGHQQGGSQDNTSGGKSRLFYQYNTRNRLVFAALRLPRAQLARWILATPEIAWTLLRGAGRRGLLRHPVLILDVLVGSLRGLAHAIPALIGYRANSRQPRSTGYSTRERCPRVRDRESDRRHL